MSLATNVEVRVDLHLGIERRGFGQIPDVLFDIEGLLDDIESGDGGFAGGGREEAGKDAHGGGFSGAVFAEKTHDFALRYFEGNILDSDMACVSLGQTFDFNHMYISFDGRSAETVTTGA